MHSDLDAIERAKVVMELREGSIDVIVGVNLLREGLDLPEVSLVAILEADKEGFGIFLAPPLSPWRRHQSNTC